MADAINALWNKGALYTGQALYGLYEADSPDDGSPPFCVTCSEQGCTLRRFAVIRVLAIGAIC